MTDVNRTFVTDRLLERLPWADSWSGVALAASAFLLSVLVFWLAGGMQAYQVFGAAALHLFFPPLVIVYMLVVVRILERTRGRVIQSLRPLAQLDEEAFSDVVARGCRAKLGWELGAFVAGLLFFIAVEGRFHSGPGYYWASLFYYVVSMLMFGAIGWGVYAVIVITRMTNMLVHQPLSIDIFDLTPLEPIGLQSLSLSLAFIGATILAVPSSPYPAASWQSFLIFGAMLFVTVLVFYLNMYGTHQLLARLKKRQLNAAEAKFARAYQHLQVEAMSSSQSFQAATELNAWIAVKHELKQTRTWPYNTEMLRTLFVSVVTPIVMVLARIVGPIVAGW